MTTETLDSLDRLILSTIQRNFPIESRPWAILAQRIDPTGELTEEKLLERVKVLRQNGFIRRLGAVFNAGHLGYRSTLCAASVPEEHLEKFTTMVNSAEQVTHNYLRSGELNVWFTFTGQTQDELIDFLTILKRDGGAVGEIYELRAGQRFKISLDFNFTRA